jgi:hypothetical protein
MRRRLWYIAYVFDILTSFQLGLPGIMIAVQSDTKRPRNILDTDFGPDSKELPPERPMSELSPVSYSIAKANLALVFQKASNISHSVIPPDHDQVMDIDRQLEVVHAEIPPSLKFFSMNQSFMDPPALIFNRFKIEMLYQKTRCVLHRRYLTDALSDPRGEYSRKTCVDAAMKLLKNHAAVFDATQDAGQLNSARWFMSSLNAHDFLLAAMIICLELNLVSKSPSAAAAPAHPDPAKVEEMKKLLQTSYLIYKQPVRQFAETGKAVRAMEIMLAKIGSLPEQTGSTLPPMNASTITDTSGFDGALAAPINPLTTGIEAAALGSIPEFEPIAGLFDTSQNMDWVS